MSPIVINGPIARGEVPGLCERVRVHIEDSRAQLLVCDVAALTNPDAVAVEALARLQLTARRLGCRMLLRHPSPDLCELLALFGLCGVLAVEPGGEAEQREQPRGVQERVQGDDPPV